MSTNPILAKIAKLLAVQEGRGATEAEAVTAAEHVQRLGYVTRRYRGPAANSSLRAWARRTAERYPGRPLLLFTATHALVAQDGRVYDNHAPHGPPGREHPYARTRVTDAFLVERRR